MVDKQDVALKVQISDAPRSQGGKPLGGKVDVRVEHSKTSERLERRDVDASREIEIGGLQRNVEGPYRVIVTRSKPFKQLIQAVLIPASGFKTLDFVFDEAGEPRNGDGDDGEGVYVVAGTVTSPDSAAVGGLRVQIVDKDVGPDIKLAETVSDQRGRYSVSFEASAFSPRRKKQPDLQARVYAGEVFLAASVEIRYNASLFETLNVRLPAGLTALPSEHETLTATLAGLYRGRLRDLEESDDRQDITFLANKSGWDARAVAMAALADQLSQNQVGGADIPAPFYYALLRAGLPADGGVLYQAGGGAAGRIWQRAVEQGVIPRELENQIPRAVETFQALGAEHALDARTLAGVSTLQEMLGLVLENEQDRRQLADLITRHRDDPPKLFWEAVKDSFGEARANRLRLDGQLGSLTLDNALLIGRLHTAQPQPLTSTEDLALRGYHRAEEWKPLLDSAIPEQIPGATPAERRDNYAELLAAQVRLSFPTAVVAERVGRRELRLADESTREGVGSFLAAHQGSFEIGMQPVEQYIARNNLGAQIDAPVREELNRLQRVYQITPNDQAMSALLDNGLDSAYRIVRHGQADFVRTFQDALGGERNALLTYGKALQVHNAVLNIAMSYLVSRGGAVLGLEESSHIIDPVPGGGANAPDIVAYPTLEKLFGSLDYCACEHCRSILSPAAYLVDLLHFLDRPELGTKNPQTLLLARRPDIQHLPLTCENTNTELPYIDLVTETLEYFLVHNLSLAGYTGHDTDGRVPSEELLASPQFVEDAAYWILEEEVFPPPLPFFRSLEAVRLYFTELGVPLHEAMEVLRQDDGRWQDILMERLGLSPGEHRLLTEHTLSLQELFGYPATKPEAEVRDELANVKAFTRRVGITYDEVIALLRTKFINPNLITITASAGNGDLCSFDQLELHVADPARSAEPLPAIAYIRILRFLRLWKKLGLTVEQTDQLMTALSPGADLESDDLESLDHAFVTLLQRIGVAFQVMDRLHLNPKKDLPGLLAFWAPIGTHGPGSLYGRMFLNAAFLQRQDTAFAVDPYGDVLQDNSQGLIAHGETLRAAFGLTGEELALIVAGLQFDENTPLTLENISAVYRRGWLARKLRLSVRELLSLIRCTGLDPFAAPKPPGPPVLRLLQVLEALRATSLKPVQALYLIWNEDISGKSAPEERQVTALARTLRAGFASVERDFTLTDDPTGETARARMALVYGGEVTDLFFALLDDRLRLETEYDHSQETLEQAIVGPSKGRLAYDDFRKRLVVSGVLDEATRQDLLSQVPGVSEAFKEATGRLVQESLDVTEPFFGLYPELRKAYDAYRGSVDPPETKRTALLASLLPELKERRKRQQAIATVSTETGTDAILTQAILGDAAVLHAVSELTKPAVDDLTALETAGAISGPWHGYLEAPETGFYNLSIETLAGATAHLHLEGDDVPLELTAGALVSLEIQVEPAGAPLRVRWRTAGRGWEPIPERHLFADALIDPFRRVFVRYLKAASLATALKLTAGEISHFASRSKIQGEGWLNALPVAPGDAVPSELSGILSTLLAFARLKAAWSPQDERLLTVLKNPNAVIKNDKDEDRSLLLTLTGWEEHSLEDLLAHFGLVRENLSEVGNFLCVHEAYAAVKTMGISASAALEAATNEPDTGTVRRLQSALLARHDPAVGLAVVKPIHDELRGLRRDALVACVLHRLKENPASAHIDTPDKLFELLLMDVQMEPCMRTSRIRHALSSVQLFIERCLMNLEREVPPSDIEADQWEWMKRYRVWEANRKVFLWPENWLEPELRDNPSPIFKETMSELLQSDITEDTAATALLNYLSKLDEVAKLEPCGIYFEEGEPGTEDDVAHVVARTSGAHRKYFYRRCEHGSWTPWEPVQLEIEDNPVVPVVWQGRVLLVWLKILKQAPLKAPALSGKKSLLTEVSLDDLKTDAQSSADKSTQVETQAVLCWSERYNGKWQAARTSEIDQPVTLTSSPAAGTGAFDRSQLRLVVSEEESGLRVSITGQESASFLLYNTWGLPEPDAESQGQASRRRRTRVLGTSGSRWTINYSSGLPAVALSHGPLPMEYPVLDIKLKLSYRTVEPLHDLGNHWEAPFFFGDARHVFYVTTEETQVKLSASDGYVLGDGARTWELDAPPLVFQPGPGVELAESPLTFDHHPGVADPRPIGRFVSRDAYIHTALATTGSIGYRGRKIGPRGSGPFIPDSR